MPITKESRKNLPGRGEGKLKKTVRETFTKVFNDLQTDPYCNLLAFAKKYPRDFYQISAKLIPLEINASVAATVTWNETKTYEAEQKADKGA